MRKSEILKIINTAQQEVNAEIKGMSSGFFGRGLASEGYSGGYKDALNDMILLLNGVIPNRRNYYDKLKERP